MQCPSALPFWDTAISKFDHENPWSRSCVWSKVKVTFELQNSNVKVMVKVKPIGHIWGLEFNRYVCFSFRGNLTTFWLRYSKFHIWPWKFTVMVMVKVKPDGHIWGLDSNRYVCFSVRGNRTILAEIQQILYLTLKIQGQSHGQDQTQWSHLSPRVQSICLLFVSWRSDHFWLRYSKFHNWPWKFKVKVTTKIDQNPIR